MTLNALTTNALDSARRKAYWGVLPLLFLCYMVAYIDRANVSVAVLTMKQQFPTFTDRVVGIGTGIFFIGYFLLEIPGSLICERWSARKWICRIMITWGVVAACTAMVKTPKQFYTLRFLLGLSEAGFFPGVIVFLSHWFTKRDRGRALAYFFVATPIAQLISPKISNYLLKFGMPGQPMPLGMQGWQWVYIFWGIPAVILGVFVLLMLPDHPRDARWLSDEEKSAMEDALAAEKAQSALGPRLSVFQALAHPKVIMLTLAYFCTTSANYGIEFFMPTILKEWYDLNVSKVTTLVLLPPALALVSQLFVGWNSDRTRERRYHAVIPIVVGGTALALTPVTHGHLMLTVSCFMMLFAGIKGLQPAFWAMPNILLSEVAAAGSIGLINSIGNLGGALGPFVLGDVKERMHSFEPALYVLCALMYVAAAIIYMLGLGRKEPAPLSQSVTG